VEHPAGQENPTMTTPSHPRPDRRRDGAPDDRAHDAAAHEFWGNQADWSTPRARSTDHGHTDSDAPHGHDADPRRKVGRWRGWLGGTRTSPNRTHAVGSVGPQRATADDPTHEPWPDQVDDDVENASEEAWDEQWDNTSPPAPAPRSGVDPLLARFGGLAVIVTLLVPAFLGVTSDSDDTDTVRSASVPLQIPSPPVVDRTDTVTPTSDETIDAVVPAAPVATDAQDTPAAASAVPAPAVTTPATEPTGGDVDGVAQALTAPGCPLDYDVVAGDFWIRLADESGTVLADLLALNDATLDTALFPGRSICLPAGADIPAPPTTAAPTTTTDPPNPGPARPTTGTTPSTRPAGTQPPTTTRPRPATPSSPPRPAPPSGPADVQAIIRAVWPDELENRAIEIAQRESKFIPTAKNSCCYGVFQMYWSVHKGWLAGLGITAAEQLYDPTVNARAALALYERSGGWGPWGG
jgi:hypothetical protein